MDFAAETESALGISAVSADPVSTALQLSDNSYGKSSNCTGGHVPLCKPRLSWDHGVGAYVVHERELLVHFCLGVRG